MRSNNTNYRDAQEQFDDRIPNDLRSNNTNYRDAQEPFDSSRFFVIRSNNTNYRDAQEPIALLRSVSTDQIIPIIGMLKNAMIT